MGLPRFDITNGTPDILEGIAPLADLFLFTVSDGRASTTEEPLPDQQRQPVNEPPTPSVTRIESVLPGGTNTLILLKDSGRTSSC